MLLRGHRSLLRAQKSQPSLGTMDFSSLHTLFVSVSRVGSLPGETIVRAASRGLPRNSDLYKNLDMGHVGDAAPSCSVRLFLENCRPIASRRDADDATKISIQMTLAAETDHECYISHRHGRLTQQRLCSLYTLFDLKLVRRPSDGLLENGKKIPRGEINECPKLR